MLPGTNGQTNITLITKATALSAILSPSMKAASPILGTLAEVRKKMMVTIL